MHGAIGSWSGGENSAPDGRKLGLEYSSTVSRNAPNILFFSPTNIGRIGLGRTPIFLCERRISIGSETVESGLQRRTARLPYARHAVLASLPGVITNDAE